MEPCVSDAMLLAKRPQASLVLWTGQLFGSPAIIYRWRRVGKRSERERARFAPHTTRFYTWNGAVCGHETFCHLTWTPSDFWMFDTCAAPPSTWQQRAPEGFGQFICLSDARHPSPGQPTHSNVFLLHYDAERRRRSLSLPHTLPQTLWTLKCDSLIYRSTSSAYFISHLGCKYHLRHSVPPAPLKL